MSSDEKEIWARVYASKIGRYIGDNYGVDAAVSIANRAVEEFKKRFDRPENYREPGR
jgi:hypothetical protein